MTDVAFHHDTQTWMIRIGSYTDAPDDIPEGHCASPGNDGRIGSPKWLPEGYWQELLRP